MNISSPVQIAICPRGIIFSAFILETRSRTLRLSPYAIEIRVAQIVLAIEHYVQHSGSVAAITSSRYGLYLGRSHSDCFPFTHAKLVAG